MANTLMARVMALITKPKTAWDEIDNEPADIRDIYHSYVMILAAIPPVATFLSLSILGLRLGGDVIRVPVFSGLLNAVVSYGLTLAGVYVFAWIINALAPRFGAVQNFGKAFQVAAYAPTASWIASAFVIIPGLGLLSLLGGLYSLYLLFVGLPKLMKPGEGQDITYPLVAIVCAVLVSIVAGIIASLVVPGSIPVVR